MGIVFQHKQTFVDEVMDLVELNNLRQALVVLPGVNGLSTEQVKRLTIIVELVANPLCIRKPLFRARQIPNTIIPIPSFAITEAHITISKSTSPTSVIPHDTDTKNTFPFNPL